MRIAIIGCGYAGAGLLCRLLRSPVSERASIDVYDSRGSRGAGYAYQDDLASNLLNRPVGLMSFLIPGDFERWLRLMGRTPGAYAPRSWFGRFVEATVEEAVRGAAIPPRFIDEAVVAVDGGATCYRVSTAAGASSD